MVPAWRKDPGFRPWVSGQLPWEQCDEKRRKALRKAWSAGNLSYKLDPEQRKVYRQIRAWLKAKKRGKRFVLDVSRRWGKSSLMFLVMVEEAIRSRGKRRRLAYWTDTGRMVEEIIILEVFPWVFEDCPPELRPTWFPSRHRIIWDKDNKSLDLCRSLELAGLDNPDNARGRSLYLGAVDEGAFIPNLKYILDSVISKMMLTEPNSALLMGSTPPISPTHTWTQDVVPRAKIEDAYHHGTIFDNCRLSDAEIEQEIQDTGGIGSTAVRRELLAEHIVDETMAIFPEASEAIRAGMLVAENPPPMWRNCYVAMDPGWSDATGVLFAYVDFDRQKLVVEDEWLQVQAPSGVIADAIKVKESELWKDSRRWRRQGGTGYEATNPHRRWTDVDHRLIQDLDHDHDLRFSPTEKGNLEQQVVRVRNWILDERVEVHPRCKKLIDQLKAGVYQNQLRRKFARQGEFGHFDLLAALVYLCRNTEPLFRKNPWPPRAYGLDMRERFQGPSRAQEGIKDETKQRRQWRQAERIKRFRRGA